MMLLSEKVAIVTGASNGIGREIALLYAEHGARLVLVGRDIKKLSTLTSDILAVSGYQPLVVKADLADSHAAHAIASQSFKEFGRIDLLVNCAGFIHREHFDEFNLDKYHLLMQVNLHSPLLLSHLVIPHMVNAGGGGIINVTSQMAKMPHPNAAIGYEVSKAGLTAATRHIALHYSQYSIRANCIAPGSIETDMLMSMDAQNREAFKVKIPMQSFGRPIDVANAALFLASPNSKYVTGATLDVNGGSWMA